MVWQIDLSGKCIVVTGGNRGIGLGISRDCAKAGANVAVIYRQSPSAPQVAEDISKEFGIQCKAYQCDVTDAKAVQTTIDAAIKDLGPLGGVVCNAGMQVSRPALEMTKDDYERQMNGNTWGVFTVAQAAAKIWVEQKYKQGRIVFINSMSATIANDGTTQCFYNASKGALTSLARCLAMEWAEHGILVNSLSPGFVDTDMNQGLRDDPERKKYYEKKVMLGRISDVEEQAGLAIFLLSPYASYITGADYIVDGGVTAW
ncbi:putative NADP-dependent mannitol dehydrogenase [Kockovaella imperatae]|uniref:Putative NADP-dependent mannitol dehydrogenase n=1 Tax=Kockovaella imperatae TaxID=4999 RepID=A0A1Y1UG49_9TREE|nr:putative NADP-dependent mannitol dehydrogenase [Kockovaella imperatae]ORX36507.1 putative NADP-dependent mannitol dehydrogenase [Kockovaella imperatae]